MNNVWDFTEHPGRTYAESIICEPLLYRNSFNYWISLRSLVPEDLTISGLNWLDLWISFLPDNKKGTRI